MSDGYDAAANGSAVAVLDEASAALASAEAQLDILGDDDLSEAFLWIAPVHGGNRRGMERFAEVYCPNLSLSFMYPFEPRDVR